MTKRGDRTKATLDEAALGRLQNDIPRAIAEFHDLLKIMRSFGVVGAYGHLEHEEVQPKACMARASRCLDLMAYHGDKWLAEDWFEPELERLRLRNGLVRFLLSDNIEQETRDRLSVLCARFPKTFKARLFAQSAKFRTVLVDDNQLLLGHYGYEVIEKDGSNAKGWKSPQLLIDDNNSWSFLIPFRAMFQEIWDDAPPVEPHAGQDATRRREFKPMERR